MAGLAHIFISDFLYFSRIQTPDAQFQLGSPMGSSQIHRELSYWSDGSIINPVMHTQDDNDGSAGRYQFPNIPFNPYHLASQCVTGSLLC